ncbi:MAG: S8 family serine peptidase [Acidobacteriota bacterium]
MQFSRFYRHILVATTLVMCSTSMIFAQPAADADVPVLVKFKGPIGAAEKKALEDEGGKIGKQFNDLNVVAAKIPPGKLKQLEKHGLIDKIEADSAIRVHDAELDNTWGVKQIGAGVVHDLGIKGAAVKVCLLDTGIDTTHPDLYLNYKGGKDFVNNDNDPSDDNGHGSHTAGTIAAMMDGLGVRGAAPSVDLYVYKVMDASGNGMFSAVIAALQECVAIGGKVSSNSYGSSSDPGSIVKSAFDDAYNKGVFHVASAGNSGAGTNTVGFPAQYASVFAVAATDSANNWASFSSTGPAVAVAAPGVSILSTYLNHSYAYMSGTSMAAPHVAGVAALVISCGVTGPANIRQRIISTAQDLGPAGRDDQYGYGLVRADLAATNCAAPPAPVSDLGVSSVSAPGSVMINVATNVNVGVSNTGNQTMSATTASLWDNGVFVATQNVPSLTAGQPATLGFSWTTATAGSHTLIGKLDTADAISTNNSASAVSTANTPVAPVSDLAVTSVSAPASVVTNTATTVNVVVKNVGNQAMAATTVTLTDNGTAVSSKSVSSLAAGASTTVAFSWSTATAGAHTLVATLATADANGANNSGSAVSTASAPAPPAPVNIVLTVSGGKHGNKLDINLKWTGATGSTVTITRSGTSSATISTNNDGAYTDSLPNKSSTYSYKVCQAGTTVCSNSATFTY